MSAVFRSSDPVVSVIIATYNWSSVLRYAVESALAQTFRQIEILVIGDGCTDDSADVMASFRDSRVLWHNLPANTGSQSGPNNAGLAMARGTYAAYLSHDDLWLPHHLDRLVDAAQSSGSDLVYSLCVMVAPPGNPIRMLAGTSKSGTFEPGNLVVPTSLLHRVDRIRELGGWQDPRDLHGPVDQAFLSSAWAAGRTFTPVRDVTCFKFPAPWRKNVYLDRPCFEQQDYWHRIQHERDFLARELTAVALAYANGYPLSPVVYPEPPPNAPPGWLMDTWRAGKGLPPLDGGRATSPLYDEPSALRALNRRGDIVPAEDVDALFKSDELPENGILLGRGWYGFERDDGGPFRWLNSDAELILTRLDAVPKRLVIDCESGPGLRCEPFELKLVDAAGSPIGAATVSFRHEIGFDLPAVESRGTIVRIVAPPGSRVPPDERILNLRVFGIRFGTAIIAE